MVILTLSLIERVPGKPWSRVVRSIAYDGIVNVTRIVKSRFYM
jgi:hypothetical protein